MNEPGIIRKLDETVVNRIAAGEIIQRPANALKELLENSLDAKSANISITVKAGGLKFLQIQDNGSGIRRDNLEIVCERFTTSKLQHFEDLKEINTYGFRGEALASISHIAHLTIMTKTASEKCAFKASYEDGRLKSTVKPCAGNQGTQITVEDLFYNVITRKKALKSPSEEYAKILDVVGSYAVHNSSVGFNLKKFGENTDLRTPPNSSVIENVRLVYGNIIARELMEVLLEDEQLKLKVHGYITNVNYSHKRGTMLLFINHRLVESPAMKRCLDGVYSIYLPKNGHSFVYLSLELDPRNVDVNVHPTKHEVHFLHEEQIIEKIKTCVEAKLLSCNTSRVMYTQARLPGASNPLEDTSKNLNGALNKTEKVYAHNLVRTDASLQKIDKFFGVATTVKQETEVTDVAMIEDNKDIVSENYEMDDISNFLTNKQISDSVIESNLDTGDKNERIIKENENHNDEISEQNPVNTSEMSMNIGDANDSSKYENKSMINEPNHSVYIDPKESFKTRSFKTVRIETRLTSIKQLRTAVEASCNNNLREILANLIFIGCIDENRSLIQYSTKLYLCNTTKLAEELFYETLLYDFQNIGMIKLSNPISVFELALLALDLPDTGWTEEDGDKAELAQQITTLLVQKSMMLQEYFSMEIDEMGNIITLPLLLDGHTPYMGGLPVYIVRLASEVNWDAEKEFFDTFCRQTAIFYAQPNPDCRTESTRSEYWKQEHILYPAVRRYFIPPREFTTNGAILQVANLPDLYKVFERC